MIDTPTSGASTPNPSRFASQAHAAEDRLQADTIGLVQLSDFRKRRAVALEAQDATLSGASSPDSRDPAPKAAFKKRKKGGVKKGALSFGDEEENNSNDNELQSSLSKTPAIASARDSSAPATDSDAPTTTFKKRALRPNASAPLQPKIMTKSALLREAQLKEKLKREYTQIQEVVKATEFMLPFVFYDGKDVPGGACRMRKGDPIWLFLERARKVGAEAASKGDKSRRDWARISVDDLMVVKGEVIVPHHYDFHYFILNRAVGYHGPLFAYSSEPTGATPAKLLAVRPDSDEAPATRSADETANGLQTATQRKQQAAAQTGPENSELEGVDDDPNATKVVDRRWYERNKHIYPASSWEEYDATRDYSSGVRKDPGGNSMFFAR